MKEKKTIYSAVTFAFSFFFMILIAVSSMAKNVGETEAAAGSTPSAAAVDSRFEFDPVVEGVEVVHEFLIENKGDSVLTLNEVETGCGCTTADYSREIRPSSTGRVVVTADTEGYGGSKFQQTITVHTNDPLNEQIILEMTGDVKKFAEISPSRLMMKGSVTENLVAEVRIVPVPEFDFKIKRAETVDLENAVSVEVEKEAEEFVVTVRNRQKTPGIYVGKIVLKTDNENKSEIEIPVLMGLKP